MTSTGLDLGSTILNSLSQTIVILPLSISKDLFSIIVITDDNDHKYIYDLFISGNIYTSNKCLVSVNALMMI